MKTVELVSGKNIGKFFQELQEKCENIYFFVEEDKIYIGLYNLNSLYNDATYIILSYDEFILEVEDQYFYHFKQHTSQEFYSDLFFEIDRIIFPHNSFAAKFKDNLYRIVEF